MDEEQHVVAAIAELERRDRLSMAAVETLSHAQDRRQRANGLAQRARQARVLVVRALRRSPPMVARDQGDNLDLIWMKTAQVAVLDQVVRVPMVSRVADQAAEVVQQGRVLEPFTLAVGQAMNSPALIEQRKRQPHHLLGMLGVVVATLG